MRSDGKKDGGKKRFYVLAGAREEAMPGVKFGVRAGVRVWSRFWVLAGVLMIAAAAGAAVYTAGYAVWNEPALDVERILAQSKLGGRTFKGEVQEVSALGGKVQGYLMEEHSVPLAAVSFGFAKAGRAYEPKPGVALLAESVLLDGRGGLNAGSCAS